MKRTYRLQNVLGILTLAMLFGAALVLPGAAGAQQAGSVSVQVYICPEEYAGPDWVQRCELLPDVEVAAYLDASEYGFVETTYANGEVSFPDLGVGEFVIELGVPGDFAGFHSYCGAPGETEPRQVEGANTNRIILNVGEGEELYCTFFVSPVDARGEVETVNTLPSTGVGIESDSRAGALIVAIVATALSLLAGARAFGSVRTGLGR
jgi:hypothetical protein